MWKKQCFINLRGIHDLRIRGVKRGKLSVANVAGD